MMDLDWRSHEEGTALQFKLLDFAIDQQGIDFQFLGKALTAKQPPAITAQKSHGDTDLVGT